MALQFSSLTGRRDTKEYNEPFVIASPTTGEFKITPKVAEVLGISDGDTVATVELGGDVYLAKGRNGTPVLDENKKPVMDERNRQVFEENTTYGVIARATVKGGSLLKFTSTKAWSMVGGSTEKNIMYTLDEGVEGEVNEDETKIPGYVHKATFYKLVFNSEKAKIVRGKKGEGEEEGDEEIEAPEGQGPGNVENIATMPEPPIQEEEEVEDF